MRRVRLFFGLVCLFLLLALGGGAITALLAQPVVAEAWQDGGPPGAAWHLAASPNYTTDGTLFVATTTGVYRSTDRGATWTQIQAPPGTNWTPRGLLISPGYPDDPTLFVAWQRYNPDEARLYRTTDDGLSWSNVWTNANLRALAISPAFVSDGTLFAAGEGNQVYRSTDRGLTWTLANTGIAEGFIAFDFAISPDFANDGTIFLAGFGPLYRSTDGGLSWTALGGSHGPNYGVAVSPNYANDRTVLVTYREIEPSGEVPESGVFRSTDGGNTWSYAGFGLPGFYEPFPGPIAFSPDYATDRTVYVADMGTDFRGPRRVYRSVDGGRTWSPMPDPPVDAAARDLLATAGFDTLHLANDAGVWHYSDRCREYIQNGDFEYNFGWTLGGGRPAAYTTAQAYSGQRSLRTGLLSGPPVFSYSEAWQRVSIPANAVSVKLRFWRYPQSGEVTLGTTQRIPETALPDRLVNGKIPFSPTSADLQYVLIVRPNGSIQWLLREKSNAQEWLYAEYDLSAYRGQTITIDFGTFNDSRGGVTAMFVDAVTLEVCFEQPATATPTPTPTATTTGTITVTPTSTPSPTSTATPTTAPTATPTPTPTITPSPAAHFAYLPMILRNVLLTPPTPMPTPPPGALVIDGYWAEKVIGDRFSNVIYAYVNGWLYRSSDDGATWNLVTYAPVMDDFVMSAADPDVLYSGEGYPCAAGGPDVPMYKSTDGGATWSELPSGKNLKPLLVHPADADTVFAAGCDAPYLTTDGGATWTAKPDTSPEGLWGIYDVSIMAAAPFAGDPAPETPNWQHVYAGGASEGGSGVVAFTGDMGTTWTRITPALDPTLWWITALETDPFTEGRLWFAEPHGVWATEDNGATWDFSAAGLEDVTYKDVPGATFGLNALVYHPTNRLYLGTVRGLYWKSPADPVWHKITGTPFDDTEITGLLFTETNPSTLYVNTVDGVYLYTVGPEPPTPSVAVLATVHLEPNAHPHGIDIDTVRNRIFVGHHGLEHTGRHLTIIDGNTLVISRTIDLGPQAAGPNGVVYVPDLDRVYIANRNSNNVSIVDATAGTVLGHIPVGSKPDGIARLGDLLYVANFESHSVSVINAVSNTITSTISPVGIFPAMVATDEADGTVYVTAFGSDEVYYLRDGSLYNVRPNVPKPYGLAYDPVRRRLYVANRLSYQRVTIIDVDTNAIVGQIDVGKEPFVVGYNPNTGHLFIVCGDEVKVYDTSADNRLLASFPLPPGAEEGIAVDTVRNRIYITSREGDAVTVISDPPINP